MSTAHSIQTIIEALIVLLLLWGFVNENKVVAIEQHIKRIVKGNYRRYKRNKQRKIKWSKTYHSEGSDKVA